MEIGILSLLAAAIVGRTIVDGWLAPELPKRAGADTSGARGGFLRGLH